MFVTAIGWFIHTSTKINNLTLKIQSEVEKRKKLEQNLLDTIKDVEFMKGKLDK